MYYKSGYGSAETIIIQEQKLCCAFFFKSIGRQVRFTSLLETARHSFGGGVVLRDASLAFRVVTVVITLVVENC